LSPPPVHDQTSPTTNGLFISSIFSKL
jgi:hypothetical protein